MIRKIFNCLYEAVSTAVILIGVMFAVLYACGIRPYQVKSGSMGDLLPVGCVCFVSIYSDYDSIEVGDVISFRVSEDMLVTHRAVSVTDEGVFTRGDANVNGDPDPVTRENYIGKTVFALPYIGYMLEELHTRRGMIAVMTGIVLLVIAGMIYRRTT